MAVGAWGIAPSEFFEMTPEEWWRIYDIKRVRNRETDYAGSLTDDDVSELYELING